MPYWYTGPWSTVACGTDWTHLNLPKVPLLALCWPVPCWLQLGGQEWHSLVAQQLSLQLPNACVTWRCAMHCIWFVSSSFKLFESHAACMQGLAAWQKMHRVLCGLHTQPDKRMHLAG